MYHTGGNITLSSRSPFDHPIISPKLLDTDFDIFTIREAVKSVHRFMSAPVWDGYVLGEYGDFSHARTDAEIEEYARSHSGTINHVSCTVPMGKTTTSGEGAMESGVLNAADLSVKGTVGLRVVDASVFASVSISNHPHG